MKIYVAIPVYDGRLHIETVKALMGEQAIAQANGDVFQVGFLSGNAGIVQARNQLAHEFMDTGFDRLVFLDSDVTFELGSLVKLAHRDEDVVGGCYRFKMPKECYPIQFLPDPELKGIWADKRGLIEVQSLPTGFLAINRSVFQKFIEAWPERVQSHFDHVSFTYFQMPFHDGIQYGEDYYFCKEWRELGGKVFLDPEIKLTHWGFQPTPFQGHIGDWLKNRPAEKPVEQSA